MLALSESVIVLLLYDWILVMEGKLGRTNERIIDYKLGYLGVHSSRFGG